MSRIRLRRRIAVSSLLVGAIATLTLTTAVRGAVVRTGDITNAPGETAFRLTLQTHDGETTSVVARPDHYEYALAAVQIDDTTIGM